MFGIIPPRRSGVTPHPRSTFERGPPPHPTLFLKEFRMKTKPFAIFAVTAAILGGVVAIAQPGNQPAKDAKQPEMQLPPGWTPQDMQAMMEAGAPGAQHQTLAKSVGTWVGTQTMWMVPDAPAMTSPTTWTITSLMDGRYIKTDVAGEMGDMGTFNGMALAGFDNVTKQYVSTWIDNHSTGIMTGTGTVSADGKTHTWNYTHNCPLTKKPTAMREVMKFPSDSSIAVEMFCTDPKTGKEFKCLQMDLKKQVK
jgi:hypothetical protein